MKKFLPYIFTLVIIANIFAPLSVVFIDGKASIQKNEVSAEEYGPVSLVVNPTIQYVGSPKKEVIKIDITAVWKNVAEGTSPNVDTHQILNLAVIGPNKTETVINYKDFTAVLGGVTDASKKTSTLTWYINTFKGNTLDAYPETEFKISAEIRQQGYGSDWKEIGDPAAMNSETTITTPNAKAVEEALQGKSGTNDTAELPDCVFAHPVSGTFSGCLLQSFYTLVFSPTAYLFALSATFFDKMFAYSIADSSYRSAFVVEGWGLVRDICNVFFIFILLYVAFATVLNIHGFKTKEMIINVVIIGLLINFSLFTTQVIIDTSNILARVFYNSEKLKPKTEVIDSNNTQSDLHEISLSQGLVAAVDPQQLLTTNLNLSSKNSVDSQESLTAGSWFILILLGSIVNIVGIIVFLSVGIFMIARVIGLWVAMVVVPFTFFSYAVPELQTMDTVGWKKWWPETIKLAFLAPIFMFFLYLILMFLQNGFQGIGGDSSILEVMLPFIFIMMFLLKAKDIAKTMSGEIGAAVMKGAQAASVAVLGGAALGAAALGRGTIGAVSKYTQNDTARGKAIGFSDTKLAAAKSAKQWWNPAAHVNTAITAVKGAGKFAAAGVAQGLHSVNVDERDANGNKTGNKTTWGKQLQKADKSFATTQTATSTLDAAAAHEFGGKMGYDKDVKYKNLKETEQHEVREEVDKDFISKKAFGKTYKETTDVEQKAAIDRSYKELDTNRAKYINKDGEIEGLDVDVITRDVKDPDKFTTTQKKIKGRGGDENAALYGKSQAIGEFVNALRKGSMDVRNLSQTKAVSKGLFGAMGVGLIATVAAAVRTGMKQGLGVNQASGQKDFIKDIKHTFEEALKSAKLEVKLDKADAHAGGGGGDAHAAHH